MIIYVHVPGFYAAVEQADHPELRGRSLIVGGDPRKRGTVTGVSSEARESGVREGMDTGEAQALCPGAELRSTRMTRYRDVAAELRATFRSFSDRLEAQGLDGTYLDAGDSPDPLTLAAELCVRLQADHGLPAVAGIGETRFVACMAAQHTGPGGIRLVPGDQTRAFLSGLDVTELWGLGPATAERLAQAGISKIGGIQELDEDQAGELLGRNASRFRAYALGEDRDPLRASPPAKSLSREVTLHGATVDLRTLSTTVSELASQLEEMLARERRVARTVTLGVVFADGERLSRTQTSPDPLRTQGELADAAWRLLERTQAGVRLVRRLRLQVSKLERPPSAADPRQLRLF